MWRHGAWHGSGRHGSATIDGIRFEVSGLQLTFETGEDGYFRIEGDDAAHRQEDCLPGLGGGMALYGDLPADVTGLGGLAGRELPFEFTGDGDDFNLCFVGSQGLLGVERGAVKFAAVDGDRVTFTFSGSFVRYDGKGASLRRPFPHPAAAPHRSSTEPPGRERW